MKKFIITAWKSGIVLSIVTIVCAVVVGILIGYGLGISK